MKVLVCGGREFDNYAEVLARLAPHKHQIKLVIQGDARGADHLARIWAANSGIHHCDVPALWSNFGQAAGPKRNQAMLLLQPDYWVAFPGGNGTSDMVRRLKAAGIPELPYKPITENEL